MTVKRVGIVGSGIMGAGIAEVAAKAGFDVVIRSRSQESADTCLAKVGKSLGRQVEKEKITGWPDQPKAPAPVHRTVPKKKQ